MKKSLLLLASALMSMTSFAQQWTKPVPVSVPTFKTSTLATDEVPGDTTIYYLYNVEAAGFLTQGAAPGHSQWSSNAIVADKGNKIMIRKYELSETPDANTPTNVDKEAVTAAEWDGKTYIITDLYSNGKWLDVIITSEKGSFMDRANQIDYKWEIIQAADGVYNIKTADVNPNFSNAGLGYTTTYFGVDALDDDYLNNNIKAVTPAINMDDPDQTPWIKWVFVEESAYALYEARIELYNTLLLSEEKQIDNKAASAVYNNPSATIEEVKQAKEDLNQAIKDAEFGAASEDNPLDVTEWIQNPNFNGNANGWTNTFKSGENANNVGYQSNKEYVNGGVKISQFIEAWAKDAFSSAISTRAIGVGELSQTITNMPQGKYMFTCDAIANNQDGVTPVNGVQLFAKGGNLDVSQKMATGNGLPEHFELTFVNDGDELTIGLRTTEECNANWIAADNFTLTYYGPTTEDPEKINMDQVVEKAIAEISLDDIEEDDFYAAAADIEAYKNAVEAALSASSDYTACGDAVTTALSALKASRNAYEAYVQEVERVRDYLNNHELADCDEVSLVSDYTAEGNEDGPSSEYENGTADYILSNKQLNAQEIAAETTKLSEMLKQAIAAGIYEGMDCTDMLVNPDFSAGNSTGWTVNINPTNFAWTGGLIPNAPVCESWHSLFDISQEVTGVPDGVYEISLNGFCRLDDGVDTEVPAEVYLNQFATPLMNLNEDPISADKAVDGVNAYLSNGDAGAWTLNPLFEGAHRQSPADNIDAEIDGGYIPNGMEGASVAFSAGRYKATAYGLVEGGTIKIGVRNTKSTHVWALWGNFRLTYLGNDASALQSQLATLVERLNNSLEVNADNMTEPAIAEAAKVAEEAEKAVGAEEMEAALTKVNEAIEAVNENVNTVVAFNNKLEEVSAALETYPDGDMKYWEAISGKVTKYASLTTAELKQLISDMDEVIARLSIPDGSSASDETPVDFTSAIKNPSFETGTTDGWANASGTGDTGAKENSNATYTISNADGSYVFNTWSADAVEGGFFVSQTVKYLPAGTYELTALVASDAGNTITLAANDVTNEVTLSTPKEEGVDLSVFVTIGENGSIDIKASSETWFKADNFRLTYYGKDSAVAIAEVNSSISATEIYSATGARTNKLQKGINIVKMSNGSVKKVLVK